MPVFLPVAGISVSIFALGGAGVLAGLLTALLGVSGGLLLLPMLVLLGVPPTVAAASGICAIIATSTPGMVAHYRMGNVDNRMGSLLVLGGLSGAWLGVLLIKHLRTIGVADLFITLSYIFVLAMAGLYILSAVFGRSRHAHRETEQARLDEPTGFFDKLPFQVYFPKSDVRASIFAPYFLCGIKGLIASVMGVGGGFIMIPMMVYFLRMPMRLVVGTDLFQILFTCAGMTVMHAVTNQTVDLFLAVIVAVGSTIGAQVGARVRRRIKGDYLSLVLAGLVLIVAVEMSIQLTLTPSSMLAHPSGGL